jgi:formate dehydrogenase major subunit
MSLDPNVHIQEVKASTCDIVAGRRPRGAAKLAFVEAYRQRAGVTEETGMAPSAGGGPSDAGGTQ